MATKKIQHGNDGTRGGGVHHKKQIKTCAIDNMPEKNYAQYEYNNK